MQPEVFIAAMACRHRNSSNQDLEVIAMWTKPAYTEMRFGFEVTMYIANR